MDINSPRLQGMILIHQLRMKQQTENAVYLQGLNKYVSVERNLQNANILSVGCAEGRDANVQAEFVLENIVEPGGLVSYLGIDINYLKISTARGDFRDVLYDREELDRVSYEFQPLDATDLSLLQNTNFDVVFFSHPETIGDAKNWKRIADQVKTVQTGGDLLIASLFEPTEADALCDMLRGRYAILTNVENEFAMPDFLKISGHKYIVVAQRELQ
jgi:hypothetical protein